MPAKADRYPRDKPTPHVKTADDLFLDELRTGCARAMAAWLKGSVNTARPINSLTLVEMQNLAEACTSQWIVMVSARIAQDRTTPQAQKYLNLMGG